jgi:hypothetical protein
MGTRIAHVAGATTLLNRDYLHTPTRRPPPAWITRWLARAGVAIPNAGYIDIAEIDRALAEEDLGTRFAVKGHLRAHDLIAP